MPHGPSLFLSVAIWGHGVGMVASLRTLEHLAPGVVATPKRQSPASVESASSAICEKIESPSAYLYLCLCL